MSTETQGAIDATIDELPAYLNFPRTIIVGTIRYRVTDDHAEWIAMEHETRRTGSYGHTHNRRATIYLNPDATPDVTRLTLWHEVLHALCEATMGSPDWDDLGETPDDREEKVVRGFESPTLAVLRDNPELVAYLTATS